MAILRYDKAPVKTVKQGVKRYLLHGQDLMTVVIDFTNGPWAEPEPFHSHAHEQTSYVASGEIIFFCEGEPDEHLGEGDMFYVPSNKKHTIQLLSVTARLIDSFNPIREDFLEHR
jgi:quercetin dioxygenase-like cupin family protein